MDQEPARQPRQAGRFASQYDGHEIEIAEIVAARLTTGEPLAEILRSKPGPIDGFPWPSHDALTDWGARNKDIERIIAQARVIGFDAIAADCIVISDDGSNDTYTDAEGNERVNTDVIARSKLRVETRLKLLAKWDPKRYGDQQAGPTVNVAVGVNVMTPEHLADLAARKRASIERRRKGESLTGESAPRLTDSGQSPAESKEDAP